MDLLCRLRPARAYVVSVPHLAPLVGLLLCGATTRSANVYGTLHAAPCMRMQPLPGLAVSVPDMTPYAAAAQAVAISGYMAFGNDVAGLILESFSNPEWLVIMGHTCVSPLLGKGAGAGTRGRAGGRGHLQGRGQCRRGGAGQVPPPPLPGSPAPPSCLAWNILCCT